MFDFVVSFVGSRRGFVAVLSGTILLVCVEKMLLVSWRF